MYDCPRCGRSCRLDPGTREVHCPRHGWVDVDAEPEPLTPPAEEAQAMECTALVHVPRPVRRYRCNDSACPGFPRGHRHRETCEPTLSPGMRKGHAMWHAGNARSALMMCAEELRAIGRHDLAGLAAGLQQSAASLYSMIRIAPVSHETPPENPRDTVDSASNKLPFSCVRVTA